MSASTTISNLVKIDYLVDMPYPFYTPDNIAWKEFAEDADKGAASKLIKKVENFRFELLISARNGH